MENLSAPPRQDTPPCVSLATLPQLDLCGDACNPSVEGKPILHPAPARPGRELTHPTQQVSYAQEGTREAGAKSGTVRGTGPTGDAGEGDGGSDSSGSEGRLKSRGAAINSISQRTPGLQVTRWPAPNYRKRRSQDRSFCLLILLVHLGGGGAPTLQPEVAQGSTPVSPQGHVAQPSWVPGG